MATDVCNIPPRLMQTHPVEAALGHIRGEDESAGAALAGHANGLAFAGEGLGFADGRQVHVDAL